MGQFKDVYKLIEFARYFLVHVDMHYSTVDDTLMVDVSSDAPSEEYAEKRILSVDSFITNWINTCMGKDHDAHKEFKRFLESRNEQKT